MAKGDHSGSLLPGGERAFDSTVTEMFATLGDETRMAILLALWEASKPEVGADALTFSELRERVGIRDSGQFNYHLDKLTDRFIKQTDEGYTLRTAGEKIVQTIIGAAGFEPPTIEDAEIDLPCPHCGGQTAVRYEDEYLYQVCTDCEGTFSSDELPEGCLMRLSLDPAACANRTPEELVALAKFDLIQKMHKNMEGLCHVCSGPVEQTLEACDNHSAADICEACGRAEPVRFRFECRVCRDWSLVPPATCVTFHPAVVSFYYDHGITLQWNVDDFETITQLYKFVTSEEDLISTDPPRVRVTIQYGDDELQLTLDENLDVVDLIDAGKQTQ